jgi:hypothetical protein
MSLFNNMSVLRHEHFKDVSDYITTHCFRTAFILSLRYSHTIFTINFHFFRVNLQIAVTLVSEAL